MDAATNIYITDAGHSLIRIISTAGTVTTIAGANTGSTDGFYNQAAFNSPNGIAVDRFGNIYIADTYNQTIRVAHLAQVTIPTLAVSNSAGNAIVSWPVPTSPFRLLSSTNPATTNWTAASTTFWTVTNRNFTTNRATNHAQYFSGW